MATTGENIVDTLQELTEFVNDRREGYERAAKESKNPEFQSYYRQLSNQSVNWANELNAYIRTYGGSAETDTTVKGKVYRQWMDIKAAFTGSDEEAILGNNIHGEEWAIKAYDDALNSNNLPPEIRQAVDRQRQTSVETYNKLKQMKSVVGTSNDVRSDMSSGSAFTKGDTGAATGTNFPTGGNFSTSGDVNTF